MSLFVPYLVPLVVPDIRLGRFGSPDSRTPRTPLRRLVRALGVREALRCLNLEDVARLRALHDSQSPRVACAPRAAPQLAYLFGDGTRTPATDEMSRCSKPQM